MMTETWRGKVLIVDDNEDNVDLAEQILEDDYDIVTANSGEACIEVALSESPDVIILDVQMPGMDGYETLSKLQEIETCKNIPVIFLSARYRDVDRVIHGLELGAFDYITKPVDDDLLQAKVSVTMRVKRAEDMVRLQREQLLIANHDLKSFAYTASHDLRAPLRHINGHIEALIEDYAEHLPADAQFLLERVAFASNEMGKLIDDLLSFSRISATDIVKTDINISEIAKNELQQIQEREPDREVEIRFADNLSVNADVNLMRIVLRNLISNAWKYTRKTEQPSIELGLIEGSLPACFYIKDNGVGFDMQHKDKLFQPFVRLHSEEDFEGNGIGLATAQRIIVKHGGTIKVEAEVNKGATFIFTLGSR